ncbi:tRNA (adenosine(37)-N6)-dimethylallyltransferase MiaA [Synechococcus elongatus]|uniref:tRNA dimethylallyltransferase n=1 Tax=Synechococcus elongatus PCC 11802 TaxID=2283154 RepID=A0AAT9K3U0_SYNEL|nr:tRNA (adenosine(37)-N6)-dimethylallyltransferase MiaA [Synechococcus elongatus]QFZ91561.1 tRNA (adenosine(37)-N6)-dimethylallyltransferase MiaA [Synechococcus elongatus PCC 11802]
MESHLKSGLIVLCGPTATGKSSLAIAIAQQLDSPILSADSRLIYRGFDIGTAKPTATEQQLAPHYLIDLCDPRQGFTVGDYQDQAVPLIQQFQAQSQIPLLVGGTGLYIKAIVNGLRFPRIAPQPTLRSQLQRLGQPLCHALLQRVDPVAAERIHANDRVRTLRALEVFYVSGDRLTDLQQEQPPTYPILQIGLDSDHLEERIRQRTMQMLAAGFITEVKQLGDRYGWDLPLLNTLGYRQVCAYLRGELTETDLPEQIILQTRQYAKQQRTWFRSNPSIHWIDADASDRLDLALQLIEGFFTTLS